MTSSYLKYKSLLVSMYSPTLKPESEAFRFGV
ncbi:MAG: hypothetical protein HW412_1635 [Bacteroidetes bacterium]|nr:hypothetical protein [Bacteroidota bacterium]